MFRPFIPPNSMQPISCLHNASSPRNARVPSNLLADQQQTMTGGERWQKFMEKKIQIFLNPLHQPIIFQKKWVLTITTDSRSESKRLDYFFSIYLSVYLSIYLCFVKIWRNDGVIVWKFKSSLTCMSNSIQTCTYLSFCMSAYLCFLPLFHNISMYQNM